MRRLGINTIIFQFVAKAGGKNLHPKRKNQGEIINELESKSGQFSKFWNVTQC